MKKVQQSIRKSENVLNLHVPYNNNTFLLIISRHLTHFAFINKNNEIWQTKKKSEPAGISCEKEIYKNDFPSNHTK